MRMASVLVASLWRTRARVSRAFSQSFIASMSLALSTSAGTNQGLRATTCRGFIRGGKGEEGRLALVLQVPGAPKDK